MRNVKGKGNMGILTLEEAIKHANQVAMDKSSEMAEKVIGTINVLDCIKCMEEHEQLAEWLEELKEIKNLEEQGKLLKLPCAVGDTVYRINKGKKEPVIPMRVIGVAIRNENELVIQTKDIADDNHNLYSRNSIGKTIFLTKEAAESALKEMSE